MKCKTISGTEVEILGMSGLNLVTVSVKGRSDVAQTDARNLVVPEGMEIPVELKELKFHDPKDDKPVEKVDIIEQE